MKPGLLTDIMKLATRKNNLNDRLKYILKGVIFLPFLIHDLARTKKENNSTALSASGDDVYPLF